MYRTSPLSVLVVTLIYVLAPVRLNAADSVGACCAERLLERVDSGGWIRITTQDMVSHEGLLRSAVCDSLWLEIVGPEPMATRTEILEYNDVQSIEVRPSVSDAGIIGIGMIIGGAAGYVMARLTAESSPYGDSGFEFRDFRGLALGAGCGLLFGVAYASTTPPFSRFQCTGNAGH